MRVLSILAIALLAIAALWLRRYMEGAKRESGSARSKQRRKTLSDLTLAERNARDERIAASVVKKWKKKGLV